jgi:hypothetical protein
MFNRHYGLMDNLSGMFTIYLLCDLKKYNFSYDISSLKSEIKFGKFLNKTYLNDKPRQNHKTKQNHKSYICRESKNKFLQELYFNTIDVDISVETNLWVTTTFENIIDTNFISNFVHTESKNLLNFNNIKCFKYNIFTEKHYTIHYRFGDNIMKNDNLINDEIVEKAKQSLNKLLTKICDDDKILIVGDNHKIIQTIIDKLPKNIQEKILFNNIQKPKHFSSIETEDELDFLFCDIINILQSTKIYFCGLGSGNGFAFLISLIGNKEYQRI